MRESVKEKKVQKRYDEEFKRQAVELVIHSGKTQAQIALGTENLGTLINNVLRSVIARRPA